MKKIDILKRAQKNLRQAKSRTLLTSLAIGVGAFTIAASLAAGEGARQYADKIIKSNVDPQAVYVSKEKTNQDIQTAIGGLREYNPDSTQYGGMTIKTLNAEDIAKLKKLDGVEKVLPTYTVQAQYVQFEGIDKKYTSDIMAYDSTVLAEVAAGALPPLGEAIKNEEVVVPQSYADSLGVSADSLIGKNVTFHLTKANKNPTEQEVQQALLSGSQAALESLYAPESKDFSAKIIAVSAKSSTSFSATSALFVSEEQSQAMSEYLTKGTDNYQKYIAATVIAKKDIQPDDVKNEIQKLDLSAITAEDMAGMIFTVVNVLQGIVTGFGFLALIASVFGIINTQYISVLERTSQIGLMKALGMSGRDVAKLFRYEAAWIGFLGGVIGMALAYVIGISSNPWITEVLMLGEGNYLLIFVWWQNVMLVIGLIIIAILAGWFPAKKAAKLDPIEALRTE